MKTIVVDTRQMLHTISTKGTFSLSSASVTPSGALWFERPMVGHTDYRHLEALLIPDMGLQVCRYTRHVGRDWFDWYIDIVEARCNGLVWYATDLYADVLLRDRVSYKVVDLDELAHAVVNGRMTSHQVDYALVSLHKVCDCLNNNGFTLPWLSAQLPERREYGAVSS